VVNVKGRALSAWLRSEITSFSIMSVRMQLATNSDTPSVSANSTAGRQRWHPNRPEDQRGRQEGNRRGAEKTLGGEEGGSEAVVHFLAVGSANTLAVEDNVLPVPGQYANPFGPNKSPANRRIISFMPYRKGVSILAKMHERLRVWLDQRLKRRECFRRHRLMVHAARRLR
jgi:hypothetical protein